VLLSSSAAPTGDLGNAVARYHLESERAVRESGLAWAFVQPNSFMSNALRWKPQIDAGEVVRGPWAGVAIATIDPADVGAVAAAALVSGKEDGQALRLSGPEALTPAEQVNALGRAIGRPLHFEGQSDDEARADMLGAGVPEPYVDAFFAFFSEATVDETTVRPTVREVLGRPPGAYDDWAIAHAAAFR